MTLRVLLLLLASSQRIDVAEAAASTAAFVGHEMHHLVVQGRKSRKSLRLLVARDGRKPTTEAEKDQEQLAAMIVPFGESSRKYVRTVYDHSDWIRHRSESRVFRNIEKGLLRPSAWRQLRREVGSVIAVSVFVIFWNYIRLDFQLGLPVTPFMMASPALGLLLVFRTNASYGRWCEARAKWGTIINHCNNIVRMSAVYVDKSSSENRLAIDHVCRATWALPRTFMNRLAGADEDADSYEQEIRQAFQKGSADRTNFADYILDESLCPINLRTSAALLELTIAIDALPVDCARRIEIDKSVVIVNDSIGSCERIFTSPVPLKYTRHTARFLGAWLLLMPLCLYGYFIPTYDNAMLSGPSLLLGFGDRFVYVIANALISGFLFGIEELAVTLEEPFSILPMQRFCDNIKQSTESIKKRALSLFSDNNIGDTGNTSSETSTVNGSNLEESVDLSTS